MITYICKGYLYWRKLGLIALLMTIMMVGRPLATSACNYVDPQISPGGYKAWCECIGGDFYSRPYRCVPGSGGGSSGTGSTYFSPSEQAIVNDMANIIHNAIYGNDNSGQEAINRQIEREKQRQRMAQQREILRQKEEQKRKEFNESKERMLGMIRGSESGTLRPRNINSLPALEVQEETGALSIKTLKPRDLSSSTRVPRVDRGSSQTFKLNCSSFLMQKAKEASARGNFEDAAYLSNEAANLMTGATESPGVECPPLPEVSEVKGVPLEGSLEQAERLKRRAVVISGLYKRASQKINDYKVILNSVAQGERKVDESKSRVEEARKQMEKVEVQVKQFSETLVENKINEKQINIQKSENQSAVQEALEALRQAEAAFKESEQELSSYIEAKTEVEEHIKDTRNLFVSASEDTDKLDDLYEEFSAEQETGGENE